MLRKSLSRCASANTPLGPSGVKAPIFGKAHRQLKERTLKMNVGHLTEKEEKQMEEDAWMKCHSKYGFAVKPVWLSWAQFAEELSCFTVDWRQTSFDMPPRHKYRFSSRQDDVEQVLLSGFTDEPTTGAGSYGHAPLHHPKLLVPWINGPPHSDSHAATRILLQDHANLGQPTHFGLEVQRHASCPAQTSTKGLLASKLSASLYVEDYELSRLPLISMSVQAYTYHCLTSILRFLEDESTGRPCYEYVSREILLDLDDVWNQLRRCAGMHPQPFPKGAHMLSKCGRVPLPPS